MPILWIIRCEISVLPGDLKNGRTLAFTNVITWGETSEEAIEKVRKVSAEYRWIVIGIEDASPVDHDKVYGDDLNDLIDQASTNANAVLFGTFHTYPVN
jgi:hypothetical protein